MTRDTYADEGYLRIGEAARRVGVSVETLRRWDREGTFTARRLPSGQRVYAPADLDALVTSGGAA